MGKGVVQTVLPLAGAAVGFFAGGGPAGAAAGYQIGSMAGGALGGGQEQQAAPGQMQQVAPGVIQPSGGGLSLSGVPGSDKGANPMPTMALPDAPGGDAAKAQTMQRTLMSLGPMLEGSEALKNSELSRKLTDAQIQQILNPPPIMPNGSDPGGMGRYGPAAGMRYLGG